MQYILGCGVAGSEKKGIIIMASFAFWAANVCFNEQAMEKQNTIKYIALC